MFSFVLAEKNGELVELSLHNLETLFGFSGLAWIDFENPSESDLLSLKKFVSLHPLTIEDILKSNKRPKINDFDDYLFLVVHLVGFENGKIFSTEIDFVLGKNFVFSFHLKPLKNLFEIKKELVSNPVLFRKGSGFLLYYVLDSFIDGLFLIVDKLTEGIDVVENEIFSSSFDSRTLAKLFRLKRNVVLFRKFVSPQREIMSFLYHHENGFIDKDKSVYFRDLFDNLVRIVEFIDTTRDMVSDAFDAYLSVVSNRLNEIMKVLTIIATVILPMTLVTGFYGMNVEFLEYGVFGKTGTYFFALGFIFLIGFLMLFWFKKNKWI